MSRPPERCKYLAQHPILLLMYSTLFESCWPYALSVQASNPVNVTRNNFVNFMVSGELGRLVLSEENSEGADGTFLSQLLNRSPTRVASKEREQNMLSRSNYSIIERAFAQDVSRLEAKLILQNIEKCTEKSNPMQSTDPFGLSCALALPFKNDLTIDHQRLATQARWCLDAGSSSVTVFGTTGEGVSVSLTERGEVLGALLSAGLEPGRHLVGGVSASSIGDAVEQIRILNDAGCQRILLAPPF